MTDKEFKKKVYEVVCGGIDADWNDEDVVDRICMYSDFREKIYEIVFGVGVADIKEEEDDGDRKWSRWALNNIS